VGNGLKLLHERDLAQGNRMNDDRGLGLGSYRSSRAVHLGRDAFPGVRFASLGYFHSLAPGAIATCAGFELRKEPASTIKTFMLLPWDLAQIA
jgi:hypothetical protein